MPYDEIAFWPAVGGGGQNNYRVPGSLTLAGSIAPGNPYTIDIGDVSGYGAIPSPAQLTHDTGANFKVGGMNQAIGLLVRRIKIYNAEFGTTIGAPPYWTSNSKNSDLIILRAIINVLRLAEGLPSYNFVAPEATQIKKVGSVLEEIRQSLGIVGSLRPARKVVQGGISAAAALWERLEASWPPPGGAPIFEQFAPIGNPSPRPSVGKNGSFLDAVVAPNLLRLRLLTSYPLPYWVNAAFPNMSGMNMLVTLAIDTTESLEDFLGEIYITNTDDHVVSSLAQAAHFSTLAFTMPDSTPINVQTPFSIPSGIRGLVTAFSSGYSSWIFSTHNEKNGLGAPNVDSSKSSGYDVVPQLEIVFT